MRELALAELEHVSGGTLFDEGGNDDLTLPTVVVPGQHIYQDPWTISIDMDTVRDSGMSVGEFIFGQDYNQLIGEASDNAWDALAEGTGLSGEVFEHIVTTAEEHAREAEEQQDWEQYQQDLNAWLDQHAALQQACDIAQVGLHITINGIPHNFLGPLISSASDAIHELAECEGT